MAQVDLELSGSGPSDLPASVSLVLGLDAKVPHLTWINHSMDVTFSVFLGLCSICFSLASVPQTRHLQRLLPVASPSLNVEEAGVLSLVSSLFYSVLPKPFVSSFHVTTVRHLGNLQCKIQGQIHK